MLVVGISSRALFDLEEADRVYQLEGINAYRQYQREHEPELLGKGTAFPLVESLLRLNSLTNKKLVEVVVMSRNQPDAGMRIFNSINHYQLDITRSAFTGGNPLSPYLQAFCVDLFLSKNEESVQQAIDAGFAAAQIFDPPEGYEPDTENIRIAFDADAVLFSDESEQIYKSHGLEHFQAHEVKYANKPMKEGPFAKFIKTLSYIQRTLGHSSPLRIAIVTARNSPAHERVLNTLRAWNVYPDEAFFLGGLPKDEVLRAFRAHIFFDDQEKHLNSASRIVPSGKVPYSSSSLLKDKQ